jgi:hypothetical protein
MVIVEENGVVYTFKHIVHSWRFLSATPKSLIDFFEHFRALKREPESNIIIFLQVPLTPENGWKIFLNFCACFVV